MGTTADKLTYLGDTKQEIKAAIIEKGQVVSNGDTFRSYADKIRSISGGGSADVKEINFYDYDGTTIKSYTIAEFANVTVLPVPPSHDGLIFQGWNWSLADIKSLGRAVNVGATYVTASGKSEFDLTLTAVTGLAVSLRIYNVTAGGLITVEWGDGTSENAPTITVGAKTFTHTYANVGDYTATVDSTGNYYVYGASTSPYNIFNKAPSYICTAVRLGTRCTSVGAYVFYQCHSLRSVTIPNSVTRIDTYAFYNCYNLRSVTIPNSVTNLANYIFYTCYNLSSVSIPNSVPMLSDYTFNNCFSLTSVTIPNSVTRIDANIFGACYKLSSVSISNAVTILATYSFGACYALESMTIPESITKLTGNVFANCHGMKKYTFLAPTPPTIETNLFQGINATCIIEVPQGSLQAYQTATNWATYANYMREAE